MLPRLDKQVTGNVGLYFCCYELSLRGWNVMPTARNAKGVDIIIYNADATEYLGIQVKTLSAKNDVPLGSSLHVMGNYWVVLNELSKGVPNVYVLKPEDVAAGAVKNERDGKVSYWLSRKHYEQKKFKGRWDVIGLGHAASELTMGVPEAGLGTQVSRDGDNDRQ